MTDRLADLIDLVLASLDDPTTGGAELARRASFSRDHLDRLLSAATGETPVGLRRRLLLERAAWRLRRGDSASQAAESAGYGSLAAFSRAFARAYGEPPSVFAASDRAIALEAPNGVHFLAPAGLVLPRMPRGGRPRRTASPGPRDLTERMVLHHLARVRELLDAAAALPPSDLQRPLRPGFVAVWFEGEEPTAALMAERLVGTLEVWLAAVQGHESPNRSAATVPQLRERFARVSVGFSALARRVRDEETWDDAFVDALCEPPQAFTLGGVVSHVLTYGAVRREMLASVLRELGATVASGDPIEWEAGR